MITDRQETGQRKRSDSDTVDHHDLQSHVQVDEFRQFTKEEIEQSIPVRFEKIVRLYPGCLAVKAGDRALTYDELNRYANRIARAILEKRGPGSEPIALLFEHGIDVIAAIYGVLKAGKFYIALDPTFPVERLRYILEDSQASMLVTNNRNANLTKELIAEPLQWLNTDEVDVSYPVKHFDTPSISLDALVNIPYTSGSTGNPKGVVHKHRQVLQFGVLGAARRGIGEQDKLSLVHSVSFGSASTEIFQSLLNGAALCLFDLKTKGIQEFANFLKDEEITICHLSPATFRLLVGSVPTLRYHSKLRLMYLSGAPITQTDYDLYKHELPTTTLLEVAMGSTETGHICSAILDRDFTFPKEGTPIGYASRGKKILILDDARSEVPLGEVGEIAVKGKNLNPGYWRRPELTTEKYLADPTGGHERIYLTGDLGRMLPDGFVIHLGRKDLMVKIRGYRVDFGEVERALLEYPQTKEAGVAAWDRDSGEKYLAGYVVPRQASMLNVSELNEFLRNKLPDYMIPSTFMFLESLPLTNGK
jgi:amino acid adenylation domain-containing protein